jgi:hypothetical protein
MDIPETRSIVERMDDWLGELVGHTGYPELQQEHGGHVYRYLSQTSYVIEVAKMARVVSGLNACLLLANDGYVAETATLLRTIRDFASEILFVTEGHRRKEGPTSDQRQFAEDFFAAAPRSVEEMKRQEKRSWLRRDEIYKAHKRLGEGVKGVDIEALLSQGKLLDVFLNGYAHGGYRESLDLYNGADRRFETRGMASDDHQSALKKNLALMVHYCLVPFAFMAMERGLNDLGQEIIDAQALLQKSPEYQ